MEGNGEGEWMTEERKRIVSVFTSFRNRWLSIVHLRDLMADTQRTIECHLHIYDSGSGGDRRCPQWITGRC